MELASNLKRMRKTAGLTQEALAEKLHLTGQAVSRWETGEGYPEITLLPTLADLLGVTVDALLRPAALTAEERYAIEREALRLEQAGQREEAIALMEEQLRLHPEEDEIRERMTKSLLMNARFLRSGGEDARAEISLRKAAAAAEALRASRDPWLRRQPETVLPEIYYLLREKDKLRELHLLTIDPYYASLYNCAVGKDFFYTFERAVLDAVCQLDSYLGNLAFRMPKGGRNPLRAGPDEPGEPLLYEPLPGEEEWTVSDAERFEIERCRMELLEKFSGGEGMGLFRELETGVFTMMLTLAAEMEDRELLLETLELYVRRFAVRELTEWERRRVEASNNYRTALQRRHREGSKTPETDAIALLTPAERELMTEPISPLPMLRHVQLFRVYWRSVPLLPIHLEKTAEQLREASFDFVREEARFRAAEERIGALVRELEQAGQLPPGNMEARRGMKQ